MPRQTIQFEIDEAVFQASQNRAAAEGTGIAAVVAQYLCQYAEGASTGSVTTYTVQRGDTLGIIAKKVYGNIHKYPLLQQANNLSDPGRIWVGQVLVIPPLKQVVAPTATAATTPQTQTTVAPPPPLPGGSQTIPPPPIPTGISAPPVPSRPNTAPPKPAVSWAASPNFNERPHPDHITAIVIHSTANATLQGVINWFNNPNAQVSAHYTIGKDGQVVQHVKDEKRAWHAGVSTWKGRSSVNDYGLGIELVNLNDGTDLYPEAQHRVNVALCAYLCHTYKVAVENIVAHYDISPGRKTDPRNYDMDRLRREVSAILY